MGRFLVVIGHHACIMHHTEQPAFAQRSTPWTSNVRLKPGVALTWPLSPSAVRPVLRRQSLELGISRASFVENSPALSRFVTPVASAYAAAAGHRKVGLKYDDLIMEEDEGVQKAIGRLTERESYDRAFRLRMAIHLSVLHRELPKEEWLTHR
ncbi:hypothetical protein A4X13_0g9193 [Tilletia indica]|uniref:Complex III subunit 7 n=1 Tax=Tilletia indica TaxID=43049 RepID=A0A8T8SAV8_9BASI|nr:hypothetical protein A4X13_0g9193 [Tilletia indica]